MEQRPVVDGTDYSVRLVTPVRTFFGLQTEEEIRDAIRTVAQEISLPDNTEEDILLEIRTLRLYIHADQRLALAA
jgi:hypothetical protein